MNSFPHLPLHFVNLHTAFKKVEQFSNIIGVCVDHLPSSKSNGPDYTIKFDLHDPFWPGGIGLPCRFFHREREKLPLIKENGDVLIIRNIKVKRNAGQLIGLSNSTTTWVVLSGGTIEGSSCPDGSDIKYEMSTGAGSPSKEELAYSKAIWKMEDVASIPPPPKPTALPVASIIAAHGGQPSKKQDRFSLVKDLEIAEYERQLVFADMLGEVRRKFANDFRVEISITDYTSNPLLYDYSFGCDEEGIEGDEYGYSRDKEKQWPGPWGRMTMLVTLWDAHAAFAHQNVQEGCFVYLQNVQVKLDKNKAKLEGHCRGDKRYPDKINVSVVKPREAAQDERLRALLTRKRDYEHKAKAQHEHFVRDAGTLKRKADDAIQNDDKPKSKKAKKREEKRKQKAEQQGPASEQMSGIREAPAPRLQSNTHVSCANYDAALKPSVEILDPSLLDRKTPSGNAFRLPFQNCRYKSKVRVVDFFPDDLADFCVPYKPSEYDMLSDHESDASSDNGVMTQFSNPHQEIRWEWRFFLLVEDVQRASMSDSSERQMELLVADKDGDFLLAMDACDLRSNTQQLAILREKLFVLWGDLEEIKVEADSSEGGLDLKPSGKPFECFIKEYGFQKPNQDAEKSKSMDYERMFRLWGTRIK